MKLVKGTLIDEGEKPDFQDSPYEIAERMGEVHLLIVAIDPAVSTEIKSATFHFPNRKEGLQAFNVLVATARNVHKTCVEDARLTGCKGE